MTSFLTRAARALSTAWGSSGYFPGPTSHQIATALKDDQRSWQVHNFKNIRLFNDARMFAPLDGEGNLISTLSWKKGTELEWRDYMDRERNYPCKKLKGILLSVHAPNSTANYYHWMLDVLPRLYLFRKAFPDVVPDHYLFSGPMKISYKTQTLDLLKIPSKKRLGNAQWHHLSCRQVYITDSPGYTHTPQKWACHYLRESFLPFVNPESPSRKRIYISRNDSKVGRTVLNQDEVLAMLRTFDIQPVVLSDMSFVEQLSLFAGAELVIAPHGAGMTNLVFCQPGTKVVEISNSNFKKRYYSTISEFGQLNYTRLELSPVEPGADPKKANMLVDITALQNIIEGLLAS